MFYGFANSQPFLHISDVPKYHQCGIYFIKNNMVLGLLMVNRFRILKT